MNESSAKAAMVQNPVSREAVSLNSVSVGFADSVGETYLAVKGANFKVADGEFVAIVGPTGCGKSTLLNVAAGLLQPVAGWTDIFGQRLVGLNSQAGYLFQADALFPWKSALDNVAIGPMTAGIDATEARASAMRWLTRVGLSAFGNRYPHMLSGGQRKRVGLAQVLIRNPKILLMDEPFGPLDAITHPIDVTFILDRVP